MPPKDTKRWKQNPDGSWSRNLRGTSYLEQGYIDAEEEDTEETPVEETAEVNATQGAIAAAAEHGINLADVPGTGLNGRITKTDVEAYAADN